MTSVISPLAIKKIRPRDAIERVYGSEDADIVNNYLDNLERIVEQLYDRTGGSNDLVSSTVETSDLLARIAQVEYDITDDPFTVDSTGWTVDTGYVTADMAKA